MYLRAHVLIMSLIVILTGLVAHAQSPSDGGTYSVSNSFHVGGEGRWDYLTVDPDNHLLYVPRTSHTMVLDEKTGKLIADIPGQKGNHGVAIVPESGRGFISDGEDGAVVIFDLKANTVLGKIQAADDADGIIYDPSTKKVLVSCGDANALVSFSPDIDPKSGKVDASIALGGKPEFLAADGKGMIYVNLEDKDIVAAVNIKAGKVVDKWSTAPGGAPVGMAMDAERRRLFIGCRKPQKLIVMNADNGKVLADLPIGQGVDATKFDGSDILSSCGDGTLSVVRETSAAKFEVTQTVTTKPGARTMGIDNKTHDVFLPTAEFNPPVGAGKRPVPKPDSFMIVVCSRS